MHYKAFLITKEFPTDDRIEEIMRSFNGEDYYNRKDEGADEPYPVFTWDWYCVHRGECDIDVIQAAPAADVQPLSVVAKHIKKRLCQTAFNTTEEKARDAIVDMTKRIDIWIDELKEGEHND